MNHSINSPIPWRLGVVSALVLALCACSDGRRSSGDVADAAVWVDIEEPEVVGGESFTVDVVSDSSVTFFTDGDNAGRARIVAKVTPTTQVSARVSKQLQICTLTQNGNADDTDAECVQGNTSYKVGDTHEQNTELAPASSEPQTDKTQEVDEIVENTLGYTEQDITSEAFRDADAEGGYDIVTTSYFDPFGTLITNKGTGIVFDGVIDSPNYGWWYDTNGNQTYQAGADDFVARPTDVAYATLGGHETDVRAAHSEGWNGYGFSFTYASDVTQSTKDKARAMAPGTTTETFSIPSGVWLGSEIDGVQRTHLRFYDATVAGTTCTGSVRLTATETFNICTNSNDLSKAALSDDLGIVVGAAALVAHKFPEIALSDGDDAQVILDLLIRTRGPAGEVRLAEALSPVGKLQ